MIARVAPEMVRYELGPLLAMARTFGRSPSQAEGLRLALAQAMALTQAPAGLIQVVRGDRLHLGVQMGLSPRLVEEFRELPETLIVQVTEGTWKELVPFSLDSETIPSRSLALLRPEVTSGLILPLRAGGPTRGILILLSHSRDPLTPGDPHLLVALGRWVGLTLERAALEEEVHRQSAEIEILTRQIRDLTASHSDPP